jgi:hypothetical protein
MENIHRLKGYNEAKRKKAEQRKLELLPEVHLNGH